MPWARVDDTFHSHPKARRAGLPALGLHLLALSYCSQHLTDGVVDDDWVKRHLERFRNAPKQLVEAGLWERVEGGYQIHDWLDFNPSAERIREKREAAAVRMAEVRANRSRNGTGR